jgi:hypothetical protein
MIIDVRLTRSSPLSCSVEIKERTEKPSVHPENEHDCEVSPWREVWRGLPTQGQAVLDQYLDMMRSGRG